MSVSGRTMALNISPAAAQDEDATIALWRDCGLTVSYNDPATDFRFARNGACSDVLVGKNEAGEILGSVMVGHDGHRGWLYYVSAHPGKQNGGLGRAMVKAGEDWLRQRGVAKVQLMVRETNTKVVPFYEKLGYEVAPRIVMSRWIDRD